MNADKPALEEVITLENFESRGAAFPLDLTFEAGFEDVFAIRGLLPERAGKARRPEWKNGALCFVYEGADKLYRSLTVHFSPPAGRDRRDFRALRHPVAAGREQTTFRLARHRGIRECG